MERSANDLIGSKRIAHILCEGLCGSIDDVYDRHTKGTLLLVGEVAIKNLQRFEGGVPGRGRSSGRCIHSLLTAQQFHTVASQRGMFGRRMEYFSVAIPSHMTHPISKHSDWSKMR